MNEFLTYSTITGLVVVVLLTGLFVTATSSSFTYGLGATGFVVAERQVLQDQDVGCSCSDSYRPVCGVVGQRLETFSNACFAACVSARVVFEDHCGNIRN